MARVLLLVLAFASAVVVVGREPRALASLVRFPLVCFTAFALLDLVASAVSDRPLVALRYGAGYLAIEILAVGAATAFTPRALAAGLLATLAVKLGASLAFVGSDSAWYLGARFMGVVGSPNPMGAAAGLALLLIALDGWYDWPRSWSRAVLVACGLVASTTLAATVSRSALVATLAGLAVVAPFSRLQDEGRRGRVAWTVTTVLMLTPLLMTIGGSSGPSPRVLKLTETMGFRTGWWDMLLQAIWHHPWLGYGAGSTPALAIPGAPIWATSAHNLYLEAGLYAGIPAGVAMALFVVGTVVASVTLARRTGASGTSGLASAVVFYAVLSLVEPVLLNGAPSSLVVPLVIGAMCAVPPGAGISSGSLVHRTLAGARPARWA